MRPIRGFGVLLLVVGAAVLAHHIVSRVSGEVLAEATLTRTGESQAFVLDAIEFPAGVDAVELVVIVERNRRFEQRRPYAVPPYRLLDGSGRELGKGSLRGFASRTAPSGNTYSFTAGTVHAPDPPTFGFECTPRDDLAPSSAVVRLELREVPPPATPVTAVGAIALASGLIVLFATRRRLR